VTTTALPQPANPALAPEPHPFVAISSVARFAIVAYFVVWRILPAIAQLTQPVADGATYHLLTVFTQVAVELLILLPFLVDRFTGSPIGWVHPLILPTVISIAFGVLKAPEQLLTPFLGWFPEYRPFRHELLEGWPMADIRFAQLKLEVMTLVSLIATYFGFMLLRLRWQSSLRLPRLSGWGIAAIFVLFLLAVMFFLERQGGVLNHMATLAFGRYRMRELSGHFLVLNGFLPYLLIFWYLYRPRALRNPVFLAAFILACVLQFVVTGSRSGLFTPVAALLVAWMLLNRRLPAARAFLLGFVAVVFLGALGEVRRSGLSGEMDFTALLQSDLAAQLERTEEEIESRNRGTNLAVAAFVPEEEVHLLGRSYVAAVAFWVPRSIWRDKPRGIGAHVAALLYQGRDSMEGYSGAGYPVNAQVEAYWNFGWPGVILVFMVFGGATRFIADWREHALQSPVAAMVLVVAVFYLDSPSTVSMVNFLQIGTLLGLTVLLTRKRTLQGLSTDSKLSTEGR